MAPIIWSALASWLLLLVHTITITHMCCTTSLTYLSLQTNSLTSTLGWSGETGDWGKERV